MGGHFWCVLCKFGLMSWFPVFLCSHQGNVLSVTHTQFYHHKWFKDCPNGKSSPPHVFREGCSVIPLCVKSLHNNCQFMSIYLFPWWLKPHNPNRGDPSGPSACVSLPLTSGPFLSTPDLSTSLRGSLGAGITVRGREQRMRRTRRWKRRESKQEVGVGEKNLIHRNIGIFCFSIF